MLSYQAMFFSHEGQCERGRTTERPRGQRQMHTFRNLPINSPKRKAIIAAVMRAPAGTTSMVQPRDEGSLRLLVPESRIELGRERVQHGNAGEPVVGRPDKVIPLSGNHNGGYAKNGQFR